MPSIDFEVYCSICGEGLCNVTQVDGTTIKVKSCPSCTNSSYDDGYTQGYNQGYNEGYDKGYNDGYNEGYNDGLNIKE